MNKPILIVDDDPRLVSAFRRHLSEKAPAISMVGPPEIILDLHDLRPRCSEVRAVVFDLMIGGSGTYATALLRKLSKSLTECEVPVIIWSTCIAQTILFEPGGVVRMNFEAPSSLTPQHISDDQLWTIPDYSYVMYLRSLYKGARAFVTKLVPDPAGVLFSILLRSGVIPPEFFVTGEPLQENV